MTTKINNIYWTDALAFLILRQSLEAEKAPH